MPGKASLSSRAHLVYTESDALPLERVKLTRPVLVFVHFRLFALLDF